MDIVAEESLSMKRSTSTGRGREEDWETIMRRSCRSAYLGSLNPKTSCSVTAASFTSSASDAMAWDEGWMVGFCEQDMANYTLHG